MLAFASAFICTLATKFIAYRAKSFLRDRGYSVSFISKDWEDWRNLKTLGESSKDAEERSECRRLQTQILIGLTVSLICCAAFVVFCFLRAAPNHALKGG